MNALCPSVVLVAIAVLPAACACPRPVIPTPPDVGVSQLDSVLITPEVIKYRAQVVIDNRMCDGLNIEEVAWGADLHDVPLFTESFTELHPMRRYGRQTVILHFQIAMEDVLKQAVDVLAEEGIRVDFHGEVRPAGFEPLPFRATRTIPLPRIPLVSIAGVDGSPLEGRFVVFLAMKNTNCFPIGIESITSHMELNGKRYDLLETAGVTQIPPDGCGRIPLVMEHTHGKALSAIINIALSGSARFGIGGSLSCRTPYGLLQVPLERPGSASAAP